MLAPASLVRLTPFQPMRYLQLVYLFMALAAVNDELRQPLNHDRDESGLQQPDRSFRHSFRRP